MVMNMYVRGLEQRNCLIISRISKYYVTLVTGLLELKMVN